MKITVKIENENMLKKPNDKEFDVSEEECRIFVERDLELRRAETDDPETVQLRTAQEIMDEFNRELENAHRRVVKSGPKACDADTIQETELQEAVVKAINSILARKSTAIAVLQENIEDVLTQENSPTKDIDGQLEELQKQLLLKANKNEQYDDLVEEIYKLREEKQKILSDKAEMEGVKQNIYNMKAFLNSQTTDLEEFNEELVRRLVEEVTVYDDRFEVELKSKLSVDIERSK